jgi:hypothetical protein
VRAAPPLVDTPLAATLDALVRLGDPWTKRAEKLAKDFKLPELAFWHIRTRAIAALRDWVSLWDFSQRNHPAGFAPFAKVAAEAGALVEAKRAGRESAAARALAAATPKSPLPSPPSGYAMRVPEYNERVELLLKLGALPEAIDAAAKNKDLARLQALQDHDKLTPAAEDALSKALAALQGRR